MLRFHGSNIFFLYLVVTRILDIDVVVFCVVDVSAGELDNVDDSVQCWV